MRLESRVIILLLAMMSTVAVNAVNDVDADAALRENPDIVLSVADSISRSLDGYSYIRLEKNHIEYNGDDWAGFYDRLRERHDTVSIVHIGDSHLQADIATGYTRRMMQENYGDAGRGIIIPFKMAKTNEPRDYSIASESKWESYKAIKAGSDIEMGFTGIAISPLDRHFDLTFKSLSKTTPKPFRRIRLYHKGVIDIDSVTGMCGDDSAQVSSHERFVDLSFAREQTHIRLFMSRHTPVMIYGASLYNDTNGVLYNVVGNNGATFGTYNKIKEMGEGVAALSPSLVVISLGANDAFGNISTEMFYRSIDSLVNEIKKSNADAKILLTTPMECHKRRYVRRKGRRRRRAGYVVNSRIQELRNEILKYGRQNSVAVYDWYEVAGGEGAANKWIADKLMSRDHIHNTSAGYEIQGALLYEALTRDINTQK